MANSLPVSGLPIGWKSLVALAILSVVIYEVSRTVYNLFFHPLRRFPGLRRCAASVFPTILATLSGVTDLHGKYGEVVRVSPNELSFSGADAYKDVYGHATKANSGRTLEKDPRFYKTPRGMGVDAITFASPQDHSRVRRVFSNAFSDRALKLQEPLFRTYVNKLIEVLHEKCRREPGRKVNMVQLYNFTIFDIMGDLTFGESLDMLTSGSYHPWVANMFSNFKFGAYMHVIRYFPSVEDFLIKYCIPGVVLRQMKTYQEFSSIRVDRRLEKENARPDIWGLMLKRDEASGLSREEMYANANVFMIAGTETTATLLSGLTWYLLRHPETMQRLTTEVRSTFEKEEDITIEKLQGMKYLHACLEEGLRMYPPLPVGMPHLTPPGAPNIVDGLEVPAGSTVMVTNLAAFRNPRNFRNPKSFVPERWLSESSMYAGDKKHGFQPFSLGPRGM